MVYLLGVTVAGLRLGRGPSVLTAVLNVVAFDLFFVPPRFTLAVSDVQYVLTFAVMLIVALVIATLMANVRQQTRVAGARERRTALLYAMSRELAAARGMSSMARIAIKHVAEVFECQAVVLLPEARESSAIRAIRPCRRTSRRRSGGGAVGRGSRSSRGPRLGHAGGRAGGLSSVGRQRAQARRARSAADESAPRVAA